MSNQQNNEPTIQPIAGVSPDANQISGTAKLVQRRVPEINFDASALAEQETAVDTFHPHGDGTLVKHIERPDHPPQRLLVDGAGKILGIARNADVAELFCNGVNFLVLAQAQLSAQVPESEKSVIIIPGK